MLDRYSRASENDISLLTELMVDGLQCINIRLLRSHSPLFWKVIDLPQIRRQSRIQEWSAEPEPYRTARGQSRACLGG
jgi:hypothetical protein